MAVGVCHVGWGGFYSGGFVVLIYSEAVAVFCFGFLVVICGCRGWWCR